MISQTTQTHAVPTSLQSPRAKLIYLFLSTNGSATISELQDSLNMKKITLYSILKTLKKKGVISEESGQYTLA